MDARKQVVQQWIKNISGNYKLSSTLVEQIESMIQKQILDKNMTSVQFEIHFSEAKLHVLKTLEQSQKSNIDEDFQWKYSNFEQEVSDNADVMNELFTIIGNQPISMKLRKWIIKNTQITPIINNFYPINHNHNKYHVDHVEKQIINQQHVHNQNIQNQYVVQQDVQIQIIENTTFNKTTFNKHHYVCCKEQNCKEPGPFQITKSYTKKNKTGYQFCVGLFDAHPAKGKHKNNYDFTSDVLPVEKIFNHPKHTKQEFKTLKQNIKYRKDSEKHCVFKCFIMLDQQQIEINNNDQNKDRSMMVDD